MASAVVYQALYAARRSPICALCRSNTDTSIALRFPHMLILHAVLDHDVTLMVSSR